MKQKMFGGDITYLKIPQDESLIKFTEKNLKFFSFFVEDKDMRQPVEEYTSREEDVKSFLRSTLEKALKEQNLLASGYRNMKTYKTQQEIEADIKDYREGQKVIATIEIEDKGQDFIELDILENGVLLGDNVMFSHGRLSLLGIGTNDGTEYHTATEVMQTYIGVLKLKGMMIYIYNTGEKQPLLWKADTLKYAVVKVKKANKPNRFIKK